MENYTDHGGSNLKAGDYKLNKFSIRSLVNGTYVELNNLFRNIEIYEDIFSPFISAKIRIDDANNLPERLPIMGQERVQIEFKTDINSMEPIKLVFRVYKLDEHSVSRSGKSQQYTLHLISEGAYFNYSQYCGYAVSGTVSSMVRTMLTKHFPDSVWKKKLDIEETKDDYSFVIPGIYTPFKAISWLSDKAHTTKSDDYTPFLFYETVDGYCFKSISKIISDGSRRIAYYTHTEPAMMLHEGRIETTGISGILPNVYLKVQKFEELTRFDQASNIMNGVVSSRLAVHDLLRKEKREITFFESKVFDSMNTLGDEPHFKISDPESYRVLEKGSSYFYLPSTGYTVKSRNNSIKDNHQVESLYLKRKYHMNSFLTQKIVITVFGDSRRRVGDIIHLDVFKPQSDVTAKEDKYDKNLSGKYLITGVRHILGSAYMCKFELSRNGMGV